MARPGRLAVLGLLTVVVAAIAILGVRVAWARAGATPHPVAAAGGDPLVSRSMPAGFATSPPARRPSPLPTAAAVLLVHVVGQVRHPGVVKLAPGARVEDAVRAAGGATERADLGGLNLARPVADGEQIVVPRPGEVRVPVVGPAGGAASGGGPAPGGASTTNGAPLELNTATAEQLEQLPGVGPVLSQRIVDWRTEHGRFSSVDELSEVSGIGDKMLAALRDKVRV